MADEASTTTNTNTNTPPPVDEEPDTTTNTNTPPPVDEEPDTTTNTPLPVEEEPDTTTNTPLPVEQEPDTTTNTPLPVEQEPDTSTNTPLPVEQEPDTSTNTPLPVEQEPVPEDEKTQLKYLQFVEGAAIYAFVWLITLYEYAKENSGPLQPGVNAVEGTVKAVIRPVYDSFRHVPFQLLQYIDQKVDDSISELDQLVPSALKSLLSAAREDGFVEAASKIVKRVYVTYEPRAKELYNEYEPVAEKYAVSTWIALNQLPLFPVVANIIVPTSAYWAERYNQVVAKAAERGYSVSYYLPFIPIDKIAKAFAGDHNAFCNHESESPQLSQ